MRANKKLSSLQIIVGSTDYRTICLISVQISHKIDFHTILQFMIFSIFLGQIMRASIDL